MTHLGFESSWRVENILLKFNFFCDFRLFFLVIFQFWDKFNAFYFCLEIYKEIVNNFWVFVLMNVGKMIKIFEFLVKIINWFA